MYTRLSEEKGFENRTVAKLAKSGGVVSRSPSYRGSSRSAMISEYFYGTDAKFQPSPKQFSFTDLRIYRAGGASQAPLSSLPIGTSRRIDPNRPTLVKPGLDLKHQILGLVYAKTDADVFFALGLAHAQDRVVLDPECAEGPDTLGTDLELAVVYTAAPSAE